MRTDTSNPHKTTARNRQSTETTTDTPEITGPHEGRDRDGTLDHHYYRCERCGLESTDPRLREGCFRCGGSGTNDREDVGDGRG